MRLELEVGLELERAVLAKVGVIYNNVWFAVGAVFVSLEVHLKQMKSIDINYIMNGKHISLDIVFDLPLFSRILLRFLVCFFGQAVS